MLMYMSILTVTNSLMMLAIISFFLSRKKVLMSLLSLEFILLNMFFSMILTFKIMNQTLSHSIFLLVLGACEASLGLSLVINMTRFKGNDMLSKPYLKY